MEPYIQTCIKDLRLQLAHLRIFINQEHFFVIPTRATSSAPLIAKSYVDDFKEKQQLGKLQTSIMHLMATTLRDKGGVLSAIIAGSAWNGDTSGLQVFSPKNEYFSADEDRGHYLWPSISHLFTGDHPHHYISPRGCAAYVYRFLKLNDIKTEVTRATYPLQDPQSVDQLTQVGNKYMVKD